MKGDNFAGKVTGFDDEKVSILDLGKERLLGKQCMGHTSKKYLPRYGDGCVT